jgi:hypothetical protein
MEANRTVIRTLYVFTGLALAGCVLVLVSEMFTADVFGASALAALIGALCCLLIFWLLRMKQILIPRVAIPLIVYALVLYLISTPDSFGVHDEAMWLFPLAISMAGLLLGRTGIFAVGTLVVLTVTGAAFAEQQGWMINRMSSATTPVTIVVIGFLSTLTSVMMYIVVSLLTESLEGMRASQNRLAEANQELQTIRSSLEAQMLERVEAAETARREAESARRMAENQMWLAGGQAQLAEQIRGDLEVEVLSNRVVGYFCRYLNAQAGLFFLVEDGELHLLGKYAYRERPGVKTTFRLGEGLVGQAALDNQQILLKKIPADAPWIVSSLGESLPRQILIAPLELEDRVIGVLELATLTEFTTQHQVFVARVKESIAIAFRTAQTRERVAALLSESQSQAEELQTREEELRATNEELLAQTEETKVKRK